MYSSDCSDNQAEGVKAGLVVVVKGDGEVDVSGGDQVDADVILDSEVKSSERLDQE